jgi:hypothetical protein
MDTFIAYNMVKSKRNLYEEGSPSFNDLISIALDLSSS